MTELKAKKLKEMSKEELNDTLKKLNESLMRERASVAMGGAPVSPGKMRSIRRQIARVRTVMSLEDHKK
ncbi:MAG: 50S ribosomal protein L29 [Candidatus Thermoplasmatota archaeon]|jgi:large subunit ribosomal protein L29|nr:50S ribosomal protein L29 [Candidatus Thermoplasmatota archaeon]